MRLNGRLGKLEQVWPPPPAPAPPRLAAQLQTWWTTLLASMDERHLDRLTAALTRGDDPVGERLFRWARRLVAEYEVGSCRFALVLLPAVAQAILDAENDAYLHAFDRCTDCHAMLLYLHRYYRERHELLSAHLWDRCPRCGGAVETSQGGGWRPLDAEPGGD